MSEPARPALHSKGRRVSWQMIAATIWLAFSLALALWWLIFGLNQVTRISQLAGTAPAAAAHEIARQHRMLLSEGSTLILLLFVGGAALFYHVRKEAERGQRLREFFAAFTHDLKTSLASLRLQAESLEEDLRESPQERVMRRLVKDTVRLELQLENSLLLASPADRSQLLLEPLRLSELLAPMQHHWHELKIEIDGDATVLGDHRAVESIFKNLLQNAVVHGRADLVRIKVERTPGHVVAHLGDNGRGFSGDRSRLGVMFNRHGTSSGSGLGLYLARDLASRMGGELHFLSPSSSETAVGFAVDVVLPAGDRK